MKGRCEFFAQQLLDGRIIVFPSLREESAFHSGQERSLSQAWHIEIEFASINGQLRVSEGLMSRRRYQDSNDDLFYFPMVRIMLQVWLA